ncbi:FHA domain-containing protein [Rubripirellula obstinata]|uniref:FHA domain-containing protein n=1 Tax=Rubripirellula obstinata TaxID=406547 RepID=UPI0013570C63|nr:FHA domain-containing protein [Rubripirellula obstinata]
MLKPSAAPCSSVTLVLAAGSRAGIEAPLLKGYYMIGRSGECQIRPKSKSVSRRHCLVHYDGECVRVLDLCSTSGTAIGEEIIEPKCWVELVDGDLLRIGKVGFHLRVDQVDPSSSVDLIDTGDAWDTFDVAGFLDSEDEMDREERYEKIRSQHKKASLDNDLEADDLEADDLEADDFGSVDSSPTRVPNEDPASHKPVLKRPVKASSETNSKQSVTTLALNRIKRMLAVDEDSANRRKLIFATICAATLLGLAAYKSYQFSAGPPVRVLENID